MVLHTGTMDLPVSFLSVCRGVSGGENGSVRAGKWQQEGEIGKPHGPWPG